MKQLGHDNVTACEWFDMATGRGGLAMCAPPRTVAMGASGYANEFDGNVVMSCTMTPDQLVELARRILNVADEIRRRP